MHALFIIFNSYLLISLKMIQEKNLLSALNTALDETFENVVGMYLDPGNSLFTTLDEITAEQASIPVGGRCASLAAQVAHVTLYLDVNERWILKQPVGKTDWGEIWRTVEVVTPAQWEAAKQTLTQRYQRVRATLRGIQSWDDEDVIGGVVALIAHTAYHLGEIRQACCTLKAD